MLTKMTDEIEKALAVGMLSLPNRLPGDEIEKLREAYSTAFGEPIHPVVVGRIECPRR